MKRKPKGFRAFDQAPNLPAGIEAIDGVEFLPDADPQPNLGRCCACNDRRASFYFSINRRCPTTDDGAWGCFVCGAKGGAAVVLCRECWQRRAPVRFGCDGRPGVGARLRIEQFTIPLDHDLTKHPELHEQPMPLRPLPDDKRFFGISPQEGDDSCLCSRCGTQIGEAEFALRMWGGQGKDTYEYRYCDACQRAAGVEFVSRDDEEEDF